MDRSLTPGDLSQIYNLPVYGFAQGLQLADQLQPGNDQYIQSRGQEIAQDAAMNPLRQQHLQGMINEQNARLPGMFAESQMAQRKNQNQATTNDAQIKDLLGKYKYEDLQREAQSMEQFGAMMQQHASGSYFNPIGAAPRAKAMFEKFGHGADWNPEWDNLSPAQLAMRLNNYGRELQQSSAKFRDTMDEINAKGQNAIDVAKIAADSRIAVAELRAQLAAEARQAAGQKDPKKWEEASIRYQMLAEQETDPNRKALYAEQANRYKELVMAAKTVGVETGKEGKINAGATTGLPSYPGAVTPPITPNTAPQSPQKHSLSDVQKMYPGVPADKLKEAYKKKFGVDLQ